MDNHELVRMAIEIDQGMTKKESRYCKGQEASDLWDSIVADGERIKKVRPDAQFDFPDD